MQSYFSDIEKSISYLKRELDGSCVDLLSAINDTENNVANLRARVEREMNLLQLETEILVSPKSLSETLDNIAKIIKGEFHFSRFDIVLIDHELRRVMRRYSHGGFGEADLEKLSRHGALNSTRDYALNNKEPWIVNDIKEDPHWRLALELDVFVHGTFPLYRTRRDGTEEIVGFLHGARNEKDFLAGKLFNEDDIKDLKRLGRAIINAIREAKLSYFEQAVMRIQSVVGSTHISVPKVIDEFEEEIPQGTQEQMDKIVDIIANTVSCQYCGIILKEKNGPCAYTFRNDKGESIDPGRIKISSRLPGGLISKALYDGVSVIENEVVKESTNMDIAIEGSDDLLHTILAVPLIEPYSDRGHVRKNVIGVIVLLNAKDEMGRVIETNFAGNENGFYTLDRQILESISPHIETIISNTRSHMDLQRLSLTDGLTELANHTHFMNDLLTLEFKRSERYGTPLSALLIDIDHFKIFNDIFGHQVGDLVLYEAAQILKNNTRGVDHVARYGGEEFAVILHNTILKDALAYAEKIRQKISEGDYVKIIREKKLFNLSEANKRFHAIIALNNDKVKEAKLELMRRQFGLDIQKVVELVNAGKDREATKMIFDSFKVTVSIGLAFYPNPQISSKKDLITTADMLLLRAKENGRNRVELIEI